MEFSIREDKSLSLGVILKREIDFQNDGSNNLLTANAGNDVELLFEKNEKES